MGLGQVKMPQSSVLTETQVFSFVLFLFLNAWI